MRLLKAENWWCLAFLILICVCMFAAFTLQLHVIRKDLNCFYGNMEPHPWAEVEGIRGAALVAGIMRWWRFDV